MNRKIDAECFGRLVADYGESAFHFAYRLTGNIEESRDLVQESFHRVLVHWGQYDPSRPLQNWLFAILRNLFLDNVKRYEHGHTTSLDSPVRVEDGGLAYPVDILPDREEKWIDVMERKEGAEMLREAIRNLGSEHRSMLTMRDVKEMSYAQIAETLQCPMGTVRSRIRRARQALRTKLMLYFEEVPSSPAKSWPQNVRDGRSYYECGCGWDWFSIEALMLLPEHASVSTPTAVFREHFDYNGFRSERVQ